MEDGRPFRPDESGWMDRSAASWPGRQPAPKKNIIVRVLYQGMQVRHNWQDCRARGRLSMPKPVRGHEMGTVQTMYIHTIVIARRACLHLDWPRDL